MGAALGAAGFGLEQPGGAHAEIFLPERPFESDFSVSALGDPDPVAAVDLSAVLEPYGLGIRRGIVFEGSAGTSDRFDLSARTGVGRLVFEWVILVMTVLVLFFVAQRYLVDGLTAGAEK